MNSFKHSTHGLRLAGLTLGCMLACGPAHSVTSCAINNAALAFGNYQVFHTQPTDGVGTVEVVCRNADQVASNGVSVSLGMGASSNGSAVDRKMSGNGSSLNYGIYSDASRTQNWAEGPDLPRQSTGPLQANESKQLRFVLYGRIPPLQNAKAGQYSDSLVITVTP